MHPPRGGRSQFSGFAATSVTTRGIEAKGRTGRRSRCSRDSSYQVGFYSVFGVEAKEEVLAIEVNSSEYMGEWF